MTDDNSENEQQDTIEDVTEELVVGENGTDEVGEAEVEVEAKPKGKSVQERIDEITAARREAERDAEYWRSKALADQKPTEATPTTSDEPQPDKYEFGEDDPAYIKDSARYEARQEVRAMQQQQAVQGAIAELEKGYTERVAAVREEIPDYDDKVTKAAARGDWPCSAIIALAAKESEAGPRVLHHLATNIDEAIALSNKSPIEQAIAFGRLEAKFLNSTAPTPKIATNAPEPSPARTKGGQFAPSGLNDQQSTEAWMKQRNAQLSR